MVVLQFLDCRSALEEEDSRFHLWRKLPSEAGICAIHFASFWLSCGSLFRRFLQYHIRSSRPTSSQSAILIEYPRRLRKVAADLIPKVRAMCRARSSGLILELLRKQISLGKEALL